MVVLVADTNRGAGGVRVLRDVVERLEAAEVDGRLHLLGVSTDAFGLDRRRDGRLTGLSLERRGETLVGEERRVDAASEVAQILERGAGRGLQPREQLAFLPLVAADELLGETELHRERHELLLCAVVEVALDLASFLVLRRDQAPPRL